MLKKHLHYSYLYCFNCIVTDVNIFLDGDNLNYTSSENIAVFNLHIINGCVSGASMVTHCKWFHC